MENKEGAFKAGCRERAGQGRAYLFFFFSLGASSQFWQSSKDRNAR